MTTLIAVQRPQFVVIAAERAMYAPADRGDTSLEPNVKIAVHGTLPIAVATAGLGRSPRLGLVSAAMSRALRDLPGEQAPALDDVLAHFAEMFVTNGMASLEKDKRLCFVVGLHDGSAARLGRLSIRTDGPQRECRPDFFMPADCLHRFYTTGKYASDAEALGDGLDDSPALATHLRFVIEDGIIAEPDLPGHDGRNIHVGGPVDVAVVEAGGAKFV